MWVSYLFYSLARLINPLSLSTFSFKAGLEQALYQTNTILVLLPKGVHINTDGPHQLTGVEALADTIAEFVVEDKFAVDQV